MISCIMASRGSAVPARLAMEYFNEQALVGQPHIVR
jgi:hypothetical protein